jgi:hypothetical protein
MHIFLYNKKDGKNLKYYLKNMFSFSRYAF